MGRWLFTSVLLLLLVAKSASPQGGTPGATTGGVAGGDLAGSYPSPTVAKLDGKVASAYPSWSKYSVAAIGNGTNGCSNANGCWQINGVLGANKAAGLTQSVTLFQLAANGYLVAYRMKSSTACTGTTTLLTGLGTASSADFYLVSATTGYDLKVAVSATNLRQAVPLLLGSDTSAAVNIVASLTATVANIDQIVTGCAFDAWTLTGVLP